MAMLFSVHLTHTAVLRSGTFEIGGGGGSTYTIDKNRPT